MFASHRKIGFRWQAVALLLGTSVFAAADSVDVTPVVTPIAGGYEYAYTITNNTPDDSFDIDIPVPADPAAITDLTAPAGFKTAFDSGLGLVSFVEDSSTFSSTPESGFFFDSPDAPGAATFQANLLSSTTFDIYTISGATLAPMAPLAAVPEPSSLDLAVAGLCLAAVWRFARRTNHVSAF